MENWYALHVRANHEHLVRLQLQGAGLDAFYPFILQFSRDRRRQFEEKFMPGYVFSRFDLAHKTPVVAIPQVVAILGWGVHAAAIPDIEIEAVRKIVSYPKLAPEPCAFVATGDLVRVGSGPLKGLEGYVVFQKNIARVVVSIAMLSRSISAEVDAASLEMIERAIAAA